MSEFEGEIGSDVRPFRGNIPISLSLYHFSTFSRIREQGSDLLCGAAVAREAKPPARTVMIFILLCLTC